MKFTQRIGLNPIQKLVQKESLDDDLRKSLWNAVTIVYWEYIKYSASSWGETKYCNLNNMAIGIWANFFKEPIDTIPSYFPDVIAALRKWYFSASWGEVYDFIEFLSQTGPSERKNQFIEMVNRYLNRENSAYRFVSGELTEITSQIEIDAVESAADSPYQNVRTHLKAALHLMNDKEHPDYRNSIKESISAVEAAAKNITQNNKATLDDALIIIERDGKLHGALKKAFSALYGYTSDANGIRHALLEDSSLKKSDARFMLISCSAFVNYLLEISESK